MWMYNKVNILYYFFMLVVNILKFVYVYIMYVDILKYVEMELCYKVSYVVFFWVNMLVRCYWYSFRMFKILIENLF